MWYSIRKDKIKAVKEQIFLCILLEKEERQVFKMKDQTCAYCMEGELVAAFGIKICELESSKVYLFKEQSHPGRVIVAHKKHVSEITELTAEERASYIEDINKVAVAMHEIFHPDKVNY